MGGMQTDLVDYPPIRFAYIATTCKVEELPDVIPPTIDKVGKAVGFSGPPRVYYVAWQDPSGGEVWIGFPMSTDASPEGEIQVADLPGGRAVRAIHDGPYHEMRQAWEAAKDRLRNEGLTKGRMGWEDYVDPKPITHVCLEVAE